ncbi:MAG TPA: translation factor GTPase family protein [Actinocatenispora sp.]
MRTLNLGILAHVDAGKTSLTERLLHDAGVIDEIGSVDAGSTQTDTSTLERRRGITIRSAVVSFPIDGVTVNLIDTPGHPDFIAEVERALAVLDGAVLVVSAVEGVQPQTRILLRTLRRMRIPTLLFVNKVDRGGAHPDRVLADVAAKLDVVPVAMTRVRGAGTRSAEVTPYGPAELAPSVLAALAEYDDELLAAYVDGTPVSYRRLRAALAAAVAQVRVHPAYVGSAITGAGVAELTAAIAELLPAAAGDEHAPAAGLVFKIDRDPAGAKRAYVRMTAGTVRVRERLRVGAPEAKVTAIEVVGRGPAQAVVAGEIGVLAGLAEARIGDAVGDPPPGAERVFAPPTLSTVVSPLRPGDRAALHAALTELADQDPLIDLRQDDVRGEIHVSLYGEVQKEVIAATLAEEYGVVVTFADTATICLERPAGTGEAAEVIATGDNPFLATVGLRVEPAPVGSGVTFRLGVELGSLPYSFVRAIEETVHEALGQGLHGWRVTDCLVTLTRSGYWARQSHAHAVFDKSMSSTAGDFRNLTPLVLMAALREAGTRVYEPALRFHLDVPADTYAAVSTLLAKLRAEIEVTVPRGDTYRLTGLVPAARVHELERRLPGLSRGEGALDTAFGRYQPVAGPPPERARTDANPLDRREYLLRVQRHVGA